MHGSIAAALPSALPSAPPVAAIRWGAVGTLVLTSLAIMGSPGPATVSLTAAASAYGARRSLGYLLGIVAGTVVVLVAVASGITAALLAVPAVRSALIAVSAAYILWLAYRIATAPPPGDRRAPAAAPSFTGGLVLGVANPKAWVAIAAVFAGARLAGGAAADAAAKVAVLSAMVVVIMTAWLVAGVSFASVLRDPCRARAVNVALAAALVGATALALLR
jgi:threonine/homoserine/homoserine lactone efflux protein